MNDATQFFNTTAGGGYQIERSLRFNSSDSAFCGRTFSSAGNRTTWSFSCWVKRSRLTTSSRQVLFGGYGAGNDTDWLEFGFGENSDGYDTFYWTTSNITSSSPAVFRDVSAWYHVLVSYNGSTLVVYVNNSTVLTSSLSGNRGINGAWTHTIGKSPASSIRYFDGYLADIHFIDGQALTPSSFTEVSATTGQLIPKAYTGSFGTNGFWLKFSDNSAATATTLGKDYSGNSNNWTPNNLSVTAGAGNDSLTDSPTSYGTGSSGGDVRGNFCTWNPLAKFGDITQTLNVSNGNLTFSGSSNIGTIGTIGMSSGKWYWELNCTSLTASQLYFGMTSVTTGSRTASFVGIRDTGVLSGSANGATTNGSGTTAFTTGDVVGFAYDADNKRLFVAKNNTWLNSADPAAGTNASFTDVQGSSLYPFISDNNTTATIDANWGARPFAYPAPSGFKALCDTSLPAPVVAKSSDYFQTVLYTGNGSTQTISGLGFSPDFIWTKSRSRIDNNVLHDIVRGRTSNLYSDLAASENTTTTSTADLVSFNANGYTLGTVQQSAMNRSGETYVAWTWDAGTSTVTNTQGSITSQVRANPSAGFSIVTYTGAANSPSTIGHGLNAVPRFVIVKPRTTNDFWVCYHSAFNDLSKYIVLSSTNAVGTAAANYWGTSSDWTSTTFGVYPAGGANNNLVGVPTVAYCFSPVAGYSSFGSYTGNGSADGPFVFCGFRPRWLVIKCSNAAGNGWFIQDTARDTYNPCPSSLVANESSAEQNYKSAFPNDMLSNGFKLRTSNDVWNGNGNTYIYAAFAENPFQYARAR